jgi:hypothetical protein
MLRRQAREWSLGRSGSRTCQHELGQQDGEGLRYWRGWVSEPKEDLLFLVGDVVDGQAEQAADGLGVEQHEAGRAPCR